MKFNREPKRCEWDEEKQLEIGEDSFGNRYTIHVDANGRFYKLTDTRKQNDFPWLDKKYSFRMLNEMKTLKTYFNGEIYKYGTNVCHKASLKQDDYGQLLLYFYDKQWMPRLVNKLWVVVKDEADADKMVDSRAVERLRVPFISANGLKTMSAHEYVGKESVRREELFLPEKQKWERKLHFLEKNRYIYVPITRDSFDLDNLGDKYYDDIAGWIHCHGHVIADAFCEDNRIHLSFCIEEGDRGDSDGYGVEPDTWALAVIDLNGKFIELFHVNDYSQKK